MTQLSERQNFFNSIAYYLAGAQKAAYYREYPIAAFMLLSALDPLNHYESAISQEECTFFKNFIHSCFDTLGLMMTSEINAAEESVEQLVFQTKNKQLLEKNRQATVNKNLN